MDRSFFIKIESYESILQISEEQCCMILHTLIIQQQGVIGSHTGRHSMIY